MRLATDAGQDRQRDHSRGETTAATSAKSAVSSSERPNCSVYALASAHLFTQIELLAKTIGDCREPFLALDV